MEYNKWGFKMRLFLDSSDLNEIEKFSDLGLISGVTTNPTHLVKYGIKDDLDFVKRVRIINSNLEIHTEAFGLTEKEIVSEVDRIKDGKYVREYNLVYKIPFSLEGLKVIKRRDIRTNIHLVYSVNQAILAAVAGATYICILVGRGSDVGYNMIKLIEDIKEAYEKNKIPTKIMFSSVRSPKHVERAFRLGVDVVTIPTKVLEKMFDNAMTERGILAFKNDYEKFKNDQNI